MSETDVKDLASPRQPHTADTEDDQDVTHMDIDQQQIDRDIDNIFMLDDNFMLDDGFTLDDENTPDRPPNSTQSSGAVSCHWLRIFRPNSCPVASNSSSFTTTTTTTTATLMISSR
jgi:hypothetical protein